MAKEQSQLEILKNKANRDNAKISKLMGENKMMRDNLQELKTRIIEKDKQCNALRERLASFRKQIKDTAHQRRQLKTDVDLPEANDEEKKSLSISANKSGISYHRKQKSQFSEAKPNTSKSNFKYPRLVEAGTKVENSFKWNHHQFSSKIKEIQVCPHPQGFIKQLNFRYEKG